MLPGLKNSLESLGLGQKELNVFMVMLANGPMLASAIAKNAGLNRTTTYGILKDLAEKGLVSSAKKKGSTRFQSIDPELLPEYIERRQRDLEESKRRIKELVPQLSLLRTRGAVLPKVQFFEGRKGVEQAYEDTLIHNEGKQLDQITGMDAVHTKLDPKFVDYYLDKRTRLGIRSTYIAPETELARKAKEDDEKYIRKVKFIPPEFNMDTEIALYDNKVGFFSYALENPVAVIIEDDTISKTMRTVFKFMERHTT